MEEDNIIVAVLPPDRKIVEKTDLHIVSMNFKGSCQWQFLYKGFKIPVRIKEGPLRNLINKGERFGKGDLLEVTLEIVQRYNPAYASYENIRFKIKEFHRHYRNHENEIDKSNDLT